MTRILVAALCAVFAVAFAFAANGKEHPAYDPLGRTIFVGVTVKYRTVPSGGGTVVIELTGSRDAYAYDPVRGTIKPAAPTARGENTNPISGVGIVVKKNPGGGAAIVVPVGEGGNATLPRLEDGTYDLVIQIPNASMPTPPREATGKGVAITFSLTAKGGVVTHNGKGAGSPKAAGF